MQLSSLIFSPLCGFWPLKRIEFHLRAGHISGAAGLFFILFFFFPPTKMRATKCAARVMSCQSKQNSAAGLLSGSPSPWHLPHCFVLDICRLSKYLHLALPSYHLHYQICQNFPCQRLQTLPILLSCSVTTAVTHFPLVNVVAVTTSVVASETGTTLVLFHLCPVTSICVRLFVLFLGQLCVFTLWFFSP